MLWSNLNPSTLNLCFEHYWHNPYPIKYDIPHPDPTQIRPSTLNLYLIISGLIRTQFNTIFLNPLWSTTQIRTSTLNLCSGIFRRIYHERFKKNNLNILGGKFLVIFFFSLSKSLLKSFIQSSNTPLKWFVIILLETTVQNPRNPANQPLSLNQWKDRPITWGGWLLRIRRHKDATPQPKFSD